ncbi:DUF58 domain-containing protein [Leptospira ryugenii]|uniref:DUF58 domain-containing protein n=1 Tax=Leptospira ryugenii TaxID=1917863 RepID=UPI000D598A55|nr:DUF58 domain-containing protein [Leptospira ryugenii]
MLDSDLKKLLEVAKWETKTKYNSGHFGNFFAKSHGRGLDFKEVRPYVAGDDTRYIDWNVTSRTGEFHLKEFYSEEDVPIFILIDISASMKTLKRKASLQILYFLTLFHSKLGNRIQIIGFSGKLYHYAKTIKRENDAYLAFQWLQSIIHSNDDQNTNYKTAFDYLAKIHPKFCVTYWLSDFTYFDGFSSRYSFFQRWENYGIWIDSKETEEPLPFWFNIFQVIDSESGNIRTNASRLHTDRLQFQRTFHHKIAFIRPEEKLANQVFSLLSRKQ